MPGPAATSSVWTDPIPGAGPNSNAGRSSGLHFSPARQHRGAALRPGLVLTGQLGHRTGHRQGPAHSRAVPASHVPSVRPERCRGGVAGQPGRVGRAPGNTSPCPNLVLADVPHAACVGKSGTSAGEPKHRSSCTHARKLDLLARYAETCTRHGGNGSRPAGRGRALRGQLEMYESRLKRPGTVLGVTGKPSAFLETLSPGYWKNPDRSRNAAPWPRQPVRSGARVPLPM